MKDKEGRIIETIQRDGKMKQQKNELRNENVEK